MARYLIYFIFLGWLVACTNATPKLSTMGSTAPKLLINQDFVQNENLCIDNTQVQLITGTCDKRIKKIFYSIATEQPNDWQLATLSGEPSQCLNGNFSFEIPSGIAGEGNLKIYLKGETEVASTDLAELPIAVRPSTALTLASTAVDVIASQNLQIAPSGGTPPYVYSIESGEATVDATGLFTAPMEIQEKSVVVLIKDSQCGVPVRLTVTIKPTFVASLVTAPASLNNQTTLNLSVSNQGSNATQVSSYKYALIDTNSLCSLATYSAETDVATPITGNVGADGSYRLCLVGKSSSGIWQSELAATFYDWTKDTQGPSVLLTGQPQNSSNVTSLNVTVTSAETIQYQYKLVDGNVCGDDNGYSSATATTDLITEDFSSRSDGLKILCVRGLDTLGNLGPVADAPWSKDTVAPTLSVTSPTVSSLVSAANKTNFLVNGNCSDEGQSVQITGSVTSSVTCVSGVWSQNLDFSAVADGTVNLIFNFADLASNPATSQTINFEKRSVLPELSYVAATGIIGTKGNAMSVAPTFYDLHGASLLTCQLSGSSAPLPTGLSLNSSTCVISGTPNDVSAANDYTVELVTNAGTSVPATVNLTVNDIPPSGLSYASNSSVYFTDTLITANNPTVGGGAVVSYSVSPSLPPGLSLNSTTGIISGTPTMISSLTDYTVTATNSGGSTTKVISIVVNGTAVTGMNLYNAGDRIHVRWNAVSWATSYTIKRSTDGTNFSNLTTGLVNLFYEDSSVVSGQNYSYKVTAVNGATSIDNTPIMATVFSYTTASAVFAGSLGGSGVNAGQLSSPNGIGIVGSELFVMDYGNKRISVFDVTSGMFKHWFGNEGSGFGKYTSDMMSTDTNVQCSATILTFVGQNIYIPCGSSLKSFDTTSGSPILSSVNLLSHSTFSFVATAAHLWTPPHSSYGTMIKKFPLTGGSSLLSAGGPGTAPGSFNIPNNTTISKDTGDNLFVLDNPLYPRLQKFTNAGTFDGGTYVPYSGKMAQYLDLIYILDSSYGNLYEYSSLTLGLVRKITLPVSVSGANSIAVSGQRLFVSFSASHEVKTFNLDGTLPSPPTAPTGLLVYQGGDRVYLKWNSVAGAQYYKVLRSIDDVSYSQVGSNVSILNYTDTSVASGGNYFYKIEAVNAGGSAQSVSLSVAIPSYTTHAASFITTLGGSGTEAGKLSYAMGLLATSTDLYVAEYTNKRISVFDVESGIFKYWFGTSGGVFGKYVSDGASTETAFTCTTYNMSLAGNILYLPCGGNIRNFDTTLEFPTLNTAVLSSHVANGNIIAYAGDLFTPPHSSYASAIKRFPASGGTPLMTFGSAGTAPGNFNIPINTQMVIDINGKIVVGDNPNFPRLQRFSVAGAFEDSWYVPTNSKFTGYLDKLYIFDSGYSYLYEYSIATKTLLKKITIPSVTVSGTAGIAVVGNKLFVATGSNSEVKVYHLDGSMPAPPVAPTGLVVHSGGDRNYIKWNTVSGAQSYTLMRSIDNITFTNLSTNISSSYYTDTGVTSGTTYYYKVMAVNAAGSAATSEVQISVPSYTTGSATLVTTIGGVAGSLAGQLNYAYGLLATSSDVFVQDYNNKRISVFDANSGAFKHWYGNNGTGFGKYTTDGVSTDSNLYCLNYGLTMSGSNLVVPCGTGLKMIDTAVVSPLGSVGFGVTSYNVVVDGDDVVIPPSSTNSYYIKKFSFSTGSLTGSYGGLGTTDGLFTLPNQFNIAPLSGSQYVVQDVVTFNRMQRFNTSGTWLATWYLPVGGKLTSYQDKIYLYDTSSYNLYEFSSVNGALLRKIAVPGSIGAWAISVFNNKLYISTGSGHSVKMFTLP